MKLPALGATLRRIGEHGADFLSRRAARQIAADLARIGATVSAEDLAAHRATRRAPLSVGVRGATFQLPAAHAGPRVPDDPALFDRLGVSEAEGFAHVHGLIEATKQAFLVRDKHVGDPACMSVDPQSFLQDAALDALAARIDMKRALPWPQPANPGDTVWLGAIDGNGVA